jgi:NAD(P)-dependent dehydrogenase (short-subunit alcohol dehydrogenase family)
MILDVFKPGLFRGAGVLVTGAAGGIGAGIARGFAALGARVAIADINEDGLDALGSEAPDSYVALAGDLLSEGAEDRLFARAVAALGRVDVLVNNAGRSWAVNTEDIDEARTRELIRLNLEAVLFLSRAFIRHARERGGGGTILQISSTAGIAGFQRRAVYTSTKFALIGLTRTLALDHAREGIRVNAILPHVVETEMFRTVAKESEIDLWRAGIPAGRFATTEEIAGLAAFLASPAGAYLTGGSYLVDGGAMAGPYGGEA